MRNSPIRSIVAVAAAVALASPSGSAQTAARGPLIRHTPIRAVAEGQPIGIMASVAARGAPIKRVTLYYATTPDASPLKVPMTSTGGTLYTGTIPSHHLQGAASARYYVEAIDGNDEWSESPWNEIRIGSGPPPERVDAEPPPVIRPPVEVSGATGGSSRRPSTTTLVIAGTAVAGAAIAVAALANSGGGGSDGGGSAGSTGSGCSVQDVYGTWTGLSPAVAPGFALAQDGTAVFLDAEGGPPDIGSWGLGGCVLSLIPTSNFVYRGSGELSEDKRSVTISGNLFTR